MQLGKTDIGEGVSGFRKVVQDLIAPELGSIKATLTALHEGQQLIREEMRAAEARGKESQKEMESRLTEKIDGVEAKFTGKIDGVEARLTERLEFYRNEVKLLIRIDQEQREREQEQRKREAAEARVVELERRLQSQPPA